MGQRQVKAWVRTDSRYTASKSTPKYQMKYSNIFLNMTKLNYFGLFYISLSHHGIIELPPPREEVM